MRTIRLLLLMIAVAAAANATIIFTENFEDATTQGYDSTLGPIAGTLFTLSAGTIDVNGPDYYPQLCTSPDSGFCIDTTGGGGQRGTITTTNQIFFAPGSYTLSFDLIGWSDSNTAPYPLNETATVQVDLGSLIVGQQYYRDGSLNPYATVFIPFTVTSATSANLVFTDLSGSAGFAGAELDNVSIQTSDPVPEPESFLLLAVGVSLVLLAKKRVRP